ncbi:Homeotic protein spalt-major, partial [Frankliniella fusca]
MISCPQCRSSQFSSHAELQVHILKYHPQSHSTSINFECASCHTRFLTLKSLKQHEPRCKGDIHNLQSSSTLILSHLDFGGSAPPSDGDDDNDEQNDDNQGLEN